MNAADAWAAGVGRTSDACEDILIGRVLDCDGRPVRHAIATLTTEGPPAQCFTFIPGTATHYFVDGAPAPRR